MSTALWACVAVSAEYKLRHRAKLALSLYRSLLVYSSSTNDVSDVSPRGMFVIKQAESNAIRPGAGTAVEIGIGGTLSITILSQLMRVAGYIGDQSFVAEV